MATTVPARSSTATWTRAVFAPVVAAVVGHVPVRQQVDERLVGVGVPPGGAHAASAPGASGAVTVARMPRAMGTRTGVKETRTSSAPAARRFCSISGMCRWVPPTAYGAAQPSASAASRCGLERLARPRVPDGQRRGQRGRVDDARRPRRAGARASRP